MQLLPLLDQLQCLLSVTRSQWSCLHAQDLVKLVPVLSEVPAVLSPELEELTVKHSTDQLVLLCNLCELLRVRL